MIKAAGLVGQPVEVSLLEGHIAVARPPRPVPRLRQEAAEMSIEVNDASGRNWARRPRTRRIRRAQ